MATISMTKESNNKRQTPGTLSVHPQKFAMWLFIATVMMFFAAFTSAYIVRQSQGGWQEVTLPDMFWINSGIIVLSSVTMHFAYTAARKDAFGRLRLMVVLTALLGFGFLAGQIQAYNEMAANGNFFVGEDVASSFVYVLTFVHAAHLISAIVFLVIVLYSAFTMKIHSKNMNRMEMCVTYWHFLGGLWIYLFMFLQLNQ